MRWFSRWYGANPLHLLVMFGCAALTGYAGAAVLQVKPIEVLLWFVGAVVCHDLVLFPLYVIADRSVTAVFRHRPPSLPTVPWINYLRVPVVLSGLLLLIWFPLIFRIPSHFPRTTDLSLNPYQGHWLAVTGALFLLSAVAYALRLRPGHRERRTAGRRRATASQMVTPPERAAVAAEPQTARAAQPEPPRPPWPEPPRPPWPEPAPRPPWPDARRPM